MHLLLGVTDLILALELLASLGSFGRPRGPELYKRIPNADRTYIKFNIVAPEIHDPDDEPKRKKSVHFKLSARWYEKGWIGEIAYPLMSPGADFWRNQNQVLIQEYSSYEYVSFYEGCDYRMPAPVGKTTYEFKFFNSMGKRPQRSEQYYRKIDLPPNHSIRLKIILAEPPYPNPKNWMERSANGNMAEYQIVTAVEP
ncbi:hypothetical protein, partial [Leptospira ellisii]|uniref:hypothetical protein n=1 Tax=Leptospira ellisii TaxID=2023197 RepID=UPI001A9F8575